MNCVFPPALIPFLVTPKKFPLVTPALSLDMVCIFSLQVQEAVIKWDVLHLSLSHFSFCHQQHFLSVMLFLFQ